MSTQPPGPLRPSRVTAHTLSQLAEGLAGVHLPAAGADTPIDNISLDSRSIDANDLYVALPGTRVHGARFAADAAALGAVAVLTDRAGLPLAAAAGLPVIVADDPRESMALMAARLFGSPASGMTMIGVTGTNGKTTTALMVEAALAAAGRRVGSIGTMGFRLDEQVLPSSRTTVTTPESPDLQALLAVMAERGADTVAMEVSSHALTLGRVAGIRFDVAGFTNLGRDHLDFHHTVQDYFEAKARLFTPGQSRACVINIDDPHGAQLAARVRDAGVQTLVTTGTGAGADYRIIEAGPTVDGGARVGVRTPNGERHFDIDLPGDYNVANAVTALAITDLVGVDPQRAIAGLGAAQVPGRMQRVRLTEPAGRARAPRVYVDFAHTPQAIESALAAIGTPGQIIVVLGAGGDRDQAKRAPMGVAAVEGADIVVVTDDNPRSEDPAAIRATILAAARARLGLPGARARQVVDGTDRRSAIRWALRIAGPDDVVALLGKGHEQGQIVGDRVLRFDDVDVVRTEWAALEGEAGR